jgi:hypothetical protein
VGLDQILEIRIAFFLSLLTAYLGFDFLFAGYGLEHADTPFASTLFQTFILEPIELMFVPFLYNF